MESRKRRGFYDDSDQEDTDYRLDDTTPPKKKTGSISEMIIPVKLVGLVIGRAGAEIQRILLLYGCHVQVLNDLTNPGQRTVQLAGTPESIELARLHINNLMAKASMPKEDPEVSTTIEILIPASKCGLVIGKGGDTMRKLRSLSGCHITLLQDTKLAVSDKPLRVTGLRYQVKKAEELVKELLELTPETAPTSFIGNRPENLTTVHVKVPREAVGAIMGVNGENIKKLSQDTSTKIQFMPDLDPNLMERSLVIIGHPSKIPAVVTFIRSIVSAEDEERDGPLSIFYLSVPTNKAGLVIGRGGEIIKQINVESGAYCELSREREESDNEKTFVIRGTDQQIEHAKHLIGQKVGDISVLTPFVKTAGFGGSGATIGGGWQGLPLSSAPSQPPYCIFPPQQQPQQPQQQQFHFFPSPSPSPQQQYQQPLQYLPSIPPHYYPTQYQAPPVYTGLVEPPNPLEMLQQLKKMITTPPVGNVQSSLYPQTVVPTGQTSSSNHHEPYQQNQEASGEIDYSEQWLEYYRSKGDEAGMAIVRERLAKIHRKL